MYIVSSQKHIDVTWGKGVLILIPDLLKNLVTPNGKQRWWLLFSFYLASCDSCSGVILLSFKHIYFITISRKQ